MKLGLESYPMIPREPMLYLRLKSYSNQSYTRYYGSESTPKGPSNTQKSRMLKNHF